MDENPVINRRVNPRQNCNFIRKITFWLFTIPLFTNGYKKEIEEEDLYRVLPEFESQTLGDKIEKEWNKRKLEKSGSMISVLWHLSDKLCILLGLTKIVSILISVIRPLVIGKLVSFFVAGQTELTKADAYLYGFILLTLNVVEAFYKQNYYLIVESLAIKTRTAFCALIFRKSLNLSVKHLQNAPIGKVASLITKDVNAFDMSFMTFNDLWTGLILTAVICYSMYQKIGYPILILVAAIVVFAPFVVFMGNKMASLKVLVSQKTDERIDIFQRVASRITCAKMYVWEKYAEEKLSKARRKEITTSYKMWINLFLVVVVAHLVNHVSYYLVFMTCIWTNQKLTAETMYFVTSGYQIVSFYLAVYVPYAVFSLSQVSAALRRYQNIIEKLDDNSEHEKKINVSNKVRIKADNATINISHKTILRNLNFDINKGLTVVVGPTSSGKSTFLLSILKHFEVNDGTLSTEGRISYFSQEPWLFPSTIKQNILFGSEYIEKRYLKVIEMCALGHDFDSLEKEDGTIVAEQGLNLSKGQQNRICLARTVYKNCDIYLLDDCLTNLDPLVADFVFKNCIMGFLKNKLVVMVTNNSNLIAYADNIITLNSGHVVFSENETPKSVELSVFEDQPPKFSFLSHNSEDATATAKTKLLERRNVKPNVYEEMKKSGSVSANVYRHYMNFGGGKIFGFLILAVFIIGQILISYKDSIVSDWVDLEEIIGNFNNTSNKQYDQFQNKRHRIFYLYTAAVISITCIILLRGSFVFLFSKNVSINLHKKMQNCVIHATMGFFDKTFLGNIINRFSKDLVIVDEHIPYTLHTIIAIMCETVGSLVLIAVVNINFVIPIMVLFVTLFLLRYAYLKVGRALKRLEATTKVPLVGYFSAVLRGLPTIKAFSAEKILKEEFDRHQDLYTSACYSNVSCMRAFAFVVDNCASLFTAFIVLKFITFNDGASAGEVGLSISQTILMGLSLFYGFQQWAEVETKMTSVERALEYTQMQQETRTGLVLKQWPTCGEIKFQNVCLSLQNCKFNVLKNLNFTITPSAKVGVVGRTGAGKSSILSVIFRLYEVEGNIIIDGVDIKSLSLDLLRSNISIIPQDPLLLQGTIRYNIDPRQKYTDDEIWRILENVKLKNTFPNLETEVVETEITYGQKQLICLARVLLDKNKILLLDEVTENGDSHTLSLIYDVIDQHFSSCTVIRITHKMKFVMNCDKVLVIEDGEIVEYDSPQNLLCNKNSKFYRMVEKYDVT